MMIPIARAILGTLLSDTGIHTSLLAEKFSACDLWDAKTLRTSYGLDEVEAGQ